MSKLRVSFLGLFDLWYPFDALEKRLERWTLRRRADGSYLVWAPTQRWTGVIYQIDEETKERYVAWTARHLCLGLLWLNWAAVALWATYIWPRPVAVGWVIVPGLCLIVAARYLLTTCPDLVSQPEAPLGDWSGPVPPWIPWWWGFFM